MSKRLFIFAGYDKDCIVDATLLHYLQSLSELGDIVFTMDNNLPDIEIAKIKSITNILSVTAVNHGEYDFGSYKRGFQYAKKNKLLDKYDWIYFVNDSVYGPLFDIKNILEDLESRGVDLIGMTDFQNKPTPLQVQSWFVGISQRVANEQFLADFMNNVTHEVAKQLIILKYEVGLSQTILKHGYKMSTFLSGQVGEISHDMYQEPIEILKHGIPFVKKAALEALNGLQFLYPYTSNKVVDDIYNHAIRTKTPLITTNQGARYRKIFRLTLLSIPLLTIYRQKQSNSTSACYKLYMFDKLPILKIAISK
jgi:rhamnosyltransferase